MKRRIAKQRREPVPEWALRFRTGEAPQVGDDGHDDYAGWRFFGEPVPGLPASDSAEGHAILSRAKVAHPWNAS